MAVDRMLVLQVRVFRCCEGMTQQVLVNLFEKQKSFESNSVLFIHIIIIIIIIIIRCPCWRS